ncbi:hypothetical protein Tco_1208826, partial [Tanacetum coccineum]
ASSSSVRRPESKDNNLKKRVLLKTKYKSTSNDVKKSQSSVSLVSNKRDTLNSIVSKSKANVLNVKIVNAVNDGSSFVCVSCGKDVFMISHDKCVACYALSVNSRVKRALFTSTVAAKSSKLGATPVVAKSRTLSTYMKTKIKTSRKWQKWFENQPSFNWSPKIPTTQTPPSVTKRRASAKTHSRTLVTKQQWVAKLSTLLSVFSSCDAGDPARLLDC